MSLRFNTFRAKRYLRSKFVEGKYLLASEASDLELEILDVLRQVVKDTIGDVAIEDAWKVELLSSTQLLIKPGQAWFKGLPFQVRSGKDQLVSGAILTTGIMPVGVSASDDATGLGKVLLFNDGALTPTNLYRMVITAKEELLTEVEDPFLQNANLTESTSQKIRLNFQINLVPDSLQTENPVPYRDESSTSLVATNFPIGGAFSSPNLVNQVTVTPTAAGNGELISLQLITGSEKIDGRDVELTLRNSSVIGLGHPIAKSPTEQAAFENGKLIDSNGSIFHINAIFNDVVSTQVVIRLDKEPSQPNPEIVNTKPFTLVKRDVYATDGINGLPQGKLYWSISKIDWDSTDGIIHSSKIQDLRTSVSSQEVQQKLVATKSDLQLTKGGNKNFDITTGEFTWSDDFQLLNPYGLTQIIPAGTVVLTEGGSLVYEMDLQNGGDISRGSLSITVTSFGAISSLSAIDLSTVRLGNIVVDSSGTIAEILDIDDINNTITTTPSLTANGVATIHRDSFSASTSPYNPSNFVLASRNGDELYIEGNPLQAKAGGKLVGGGTWSWSTGPDQLTFTSNAFIEKSGLSYSDNTISTSESPISLSSDGDVAYILPNDVSGGPNLSITVDTLDNVPLDGIIIARRIGSSVVVGSSSTLLKFGQSTELYAQMSDQNLTYIGAASTSTSSPSYSSNIRGTSGESLSSRSSVNTDALGDSQEDRSAYLRSDQEVTWTGTQLQFASDIVLEVLNTKSGTLTQHSILSSGSPISLANGESAWISINRSSASESVTLHLSGTLAIPAQTQANKDVFIIARRVDVSGSGYLHLPLHKQVLSPNQTVRLGASGSGSGNVKATFLDPISTTLPTGVSYTADGMAAVNNDTILFTKLASGNNEIYKISGVGTSIVFTAQNSFSTGSTPSLGDSVRIQKGNAFAEQLAVFDGTYFKVNDTVRHFDGVSADFWEQSSVKTITLANNTTANVFTVAYTGSENMIISYSILRASLKETGELYLTTDGVTAHLARGNSYIGDPGISFSASISGSDLLLDYTSTNSGSSGTLKYFVKRWSDASGGPTGIPNYGTGGGGGSTPAAGSLGEVQFNGSGNLLDADSRFKWNGSDSAIDLNGLEIGSLSSSITLLDNQSSPVTAISYGTTFNYAILEYSIVRNGERRVGELTISTDGLSIDMVEEYMETAPNGVVFSAVINGANVNIKYTSTNTGFSGTLKYSFRRWA